MQESSSLHWTEAPVASACYFTEVGGSCVLYRSVLSSFLWLGDMEYGVGDVRRLADLDHWYLCNIVRRLGIQR